MFDDFDSMTNIHMIIRIDFGIHYRIRNLTGVCMCAFGTLINPTYLSDSNFEQSTAASRDALGVPSS